MRPANPETITSLDDFKVAEEPKTELFTVAEKEPKKPEGKLSYEARKRIEAEQAEALKVFRQIPQEIEQNYGNIVLERVFPELQLDSNTIFALKTGKKIKSNVTGETLSPAEMRDHWILPRGEQISKSTGSIYFPEKATQEHDMGNSFLFWEFDNFKKLLDSKDPISPKVGIDTERGDISGFEVASLDKDEYEEVYPKNVEGTPQEVEISETDEEFAGEFSKSAQNRADEDALYASINEPYIPRHPETQQDVYKITRSETDSTLPLPIEGEGKSIAEKMWSQVSPLFPKEAKVRNSPETFFKVYDPVLISQDLVIIKPKTPGNPLECMAFAQKRDKKHGDEWVGLVVLGSKHPDKQPEYQAFNVSKKTVEKHDEGEKVQKVDYAENEVSLIMTKWLASLERRDKNGDYVYGYHTAALSPAKKTAT